MKQMQNQRNDAGITLVALIITIIILVILAAVSISAVYNSKIVDYAVNGATDYAGEAVKENEIMSGTESLIDSTVKKIEDILGGKTPPETTTPEEPTPGPQKGLTAEQLKEKIGAYVNYTPDTPENATYSTTQDGEERSGESEQTITRDTSLKWRIMNAEGDKVTLISETIPSGKLILRGADGYNNGVKLLNDAANALYKNTTYGATARNLNVNDVNSLMGYTPSVGKEYTPSSKYYPKIFQYETWGSINGSYTGSLGLSEQSSWYSGGGQANTLKGKYTYYSYTLSSYKALSTVQHALATGQANGTESTSHTTYWLTSRCVYYDSTYSCFYFRMFYVNNGSVGAYILCASTNSAWNKPSYALRPAIEIDLTKANIGETGTGESTDPYSIAVR